MRGLLCRVCGNVCCVAVIVKDSGFLVLKYVCVRDVMDVFCLYCDLWSCMC